MSNYEKLCELFVSRTVRANEAKTDLERLYATSERRGILDCIIALFGQVGGGQAVMEADAHYLSQGVYRPMTGGVFHDWEASA